MNKTPALMFLAVVLLCACAATQQKQPYEPKIAISVKSSVEPVLQYARQFGDLSAEMQKKELAQINQKLALNSQDQITRITVALLYGIPTNKTRDTARSLALFDEALQDKRLGQDTEAMAILFRDMVQENIKLNQKLKEEQKQSGVLQQKLEELKNIEKAMGAREQPTGK